VKFYFPQFSFPHSLMTPWLIYPQTNVAQTQSTAKFRLFCLPYSGAGAAIFRAWAAPLAPDIEVVAIQLPGRETRRQEPLLTNLPALIQALTPVLCPYLDRPFVLFGHSVGALICFELARQLRRIDHREPFHLVVSGRPAPQLPALTPAIHQLPDADFLQELRRYNGTPEIVLQNVELMNLFMPILRADLAINETYVYTPERPFDFSMTVLGGLHDPQVSEIDLASWREQTNSKFSLKMLPGDHFFLKQQQTEILEIISSLKNLIPNE
jgi:medium-chain acyl-[acyl-carrier-protein] hydrolase